MRVVVRKADIKTGTRKDGSPFTGTSCLVQFPDGCTAINVFVGEELIDPCNIQVGSPYDMYRDEKGYVTVFDPIKES